MINTAHLLAAYDEQLRSDSRPILERSGLINVSTTTPYRWQR
ncbi:hypothetical protein [Actinoplanes solisilvae]|nr:hypothetical protein [Actinoplanes solisilvae]